MNLHKSKIEWCTHTWNPVTGCLHGCPYCYARRQIARFEPHQCERPEEDYQEGREEPFEHVAGNPGIVTEPVRLVDETGQYLRSTPYPWGFDPTMHEYTLNYPYKRKIPSLVFVSSMGDLFGEWVPIEWIRSVFNACERAPQHVYMFLTKNPRRYEALALNGQLPTGPNYWFGSTATRPTMPVWTRSGYHSFVSIEPMLESFEAEASLFRRVGWVIVGAQTGPGSRQHQPRPSWIEDVYDKCRDTHTPIFMKNSIETLWPPFPDMPQEWPKSMTDCIKPKKGGS
jgi:protein gp37